MPPNLISKQLKSHSAPCVGDETVFKNDFGAKPSCHQHRALNDLLDVGDGMVEFNKKCLETGENK